MRHVTKAVTQSLLVLRRHAAWRCLWSGLGIEGVWKLSIKGSRVPWSGVDKRSGSSGTVRGHTRVWLPDLGWASLCLSFPEAPYRFWEGRIRTSGDVGDVRCDQVDGGSMVSRELTSGLCPQTGLGYLVSSGIIHCGWCLWHHNSQLDTQ